ncbi:ATP-binding protein [Puniceibacterium sediminis]|uniref:histidine kinase n=1 Tax=Puniceibacterium sediminis TaxID=1608407 RepID=A0A238WXW9_9RHOB|nr:ATP-binding protein [Puniceibacterium sediminis]SNR51263.1 Signal transduction histidine kinase [Puniceibacterium sediminis]
MMKSRWRRHSDKVEIIARAAMLIFAMIFTTESAAIYFAHLTNMSERRAQRADNMLRESERSRQATELAVIRAQKVEALGNLVGGVAHDFNNTLTVILGNLELIEEDEDENQCAIYVKEAIIASNHAAQLTRQLLAYGRKSRLEPLPSVLDDLIETTLSMFRRVSPANISVSTALSAPHATVLVDVANMQQALLNILINARDAQPEGGAIHIHSEVGQLSHETVVGFNDGERLPDGLYVTIAVCDKGPGMPPETLARAAEPFFTTKDVGEGSGLGLSVVAGFCRQSGGGLKLSSQPGGGLKVMMAFPVIQVEPKSDTIPEPISRPDAFEGGDILIVDDELQVTRVLARQLEFDGHRVRVALNAEQALSILAGEQLPDLVLSDLVMPGEMQGNALAKVIAELYPSIRIILMSGYESGQGRGNLGLIRDVPFLQKPIDRTLLRATVQQALCQAGPSAPVEPVEG